jgi:WD40 repeat protein
MSEKELLELKRRDFKAFNAIMNPFPGLRPFGVEESHLFFGREGQSDEVLEKLADNKFVAILGTSGSGKSSLMYCGVIPILHGGFLTKAGSNWRIVVARPGVNPIDNLAEGLLMKDKEYMDADEDGKLLKRTMNASVLRSSSLGLIEAVRQMNKTENENFFILIDQFEELFRYNRVQSRLSDANESVAFVNLLLEAINQSEQPIYVAITMRSDFIGDCAQFQELTQKINDSHYLIPQMTREQKREAIEGPVAVGGGKVSQRLIQQILNDVGDSPDQLPIMQHALMRTWSYWAENSVDFDEPMDLKHYNAIGRMADALNLHADEAYNELSKREQKICEIMYKALTEAGTESSGIRRPTELGVIAKIAGVNANEVAKIVDKFREPGRSLLMPPYGIKLEQQTVIDISHESLMRNWTRLKAWVEEEYSSASMYLKLADAARAYQEGRSSLWKMPDLQLAINWKNESNPTLVWGQRYHPAFERTMVFLQTSTEEYEKEKANRERIQKRKLRRSRNLAIIFGLIGLVAIFLVVFAQIQAAEAKKQEAAALVAQQKAEDNAKLAQEQEAIAKTEKEAADAARADAVKQAQIAEEQRQQAEIERENAVQQQRIAEEQRKIAEEQTLVANAATKQAEEQAQIAQEQRKQAEEARDQADRLRFQSIARSLAIKSLQVEDTAVRALIALQAFKFNSEYQGNVYDHDIYSGLYEALRLIKDEKINFLEGHSATIWAVDFSSSSDRFFSASADGKIIQWDKVDGQWTGSDLYAGGDLIRSMVVSKDNTKLYAGLSSGEILAFNLDKPTNDPTKISGHSGQVILLSELSKPDRFVSADISNDLRLYAEGSSTSLNTFNQKIRALAAHPTKDLVVVGLADGTGIIWDLNSNEQQPLPFRMDENGLTALQFSKDGRFLGAGDYSGAIKLYQFDEGVTFADLKGDKSQVTDIEFSKDNELLAVSTRGRLSNIYVMDNINELPISLSYFEDWASTVAFSPDGRTLITGSHDDVVRFWPMDMERFTEDYCAELETNLSDTEWGQYVGEDVAYDNTCPDLPKGE